MATNANDNNEKQFSKDEQEGQSNQADAKNPKTVTTTASTKITNVAKKQSSEKSMQSPCVQEDKSMAPELLTLQSGTPIAPKTPTTDDDIDREAENQKDPGRGGNIGLASPPDNQYFFEDEVFRIDKKGHIKFGLITETAETYSADEDEDFEEMVLKGEVRIAWYPEGKEEVHVESAIGLADRTLMPGDVVRRLVPGKDTQRGYCRNISCHADVKVLGTKYVIKNVMTERLRPINCWQRDSAVCLDSWVGSTKDVEEKAVLKSTAGTRIEITCQNFYGFTDYYSRDSQGIFNPHVFFPGNVIIGRLQSLDNVKLLTPNIPIHKNKKGKPLRGKYTIESVETDSVWVHWQCKALSEESSIDTCILEQPNPCVSGEDLKRLKRLNLFESCMLQISDRNYLKFSNLDSYIKKSQWEKEQASKFKVILEQIQKNEKQSGKNSSSGNESFTNLYNSNHAERARKKSSLIDVDAKMVKPKKSTLKTEKLSTASKEKNTNEASPENTASNVLPTRKSSKSSGDTEWVTDDEDEDDDDDVYSNDDFFADRVSTTTCSSPSPHQSPKHSKRHLLKKKSKTTNKPSPLLLPEFQPKEGDELVTETLLVYSTATVVWQDGTVEAGIPATQLYPIHHLDNHEFFPGDFVVSGKEEGDITYRDYGVVQTVDHQGRIARVKWFTTYTSADEPKPTYNGETEVSVYDLKDHPDFQYRPGTMVIRVANFSGEDAVCTAGQVIDNYIDGRAKVWWVDGHISMCWPQDLFEVGQYDHADWGHESDDSWETESENSELGGSTPVIALEESHIITNIERTRVAIARLEEIFNISPNLQNADVMKNLLNVYKGCRYLDRLLNTSFFHEDNFQGLIERVRKGGTQSISERAQDRKNRLFSYVHAASPNTKQQQQQQQQQQLSQPISMRGQRQQHSHYYAVASLDSAQKTPKAATSSDGTNDSTKSKEYAPKILFNISPTPFKSPSSLVNVPGSSATYSASGAAASVALPALKLKSATSISTVTLAPSAHNVPVKSVSKTTAISNETAAAATGQEDSNTQSVPDGKAMMATRAGASNSLAHQQSMFAQNNQLLNSAMMNIERAFEKTCQLKSVIATSQDDSGNYSRNENCDGSSTSHASYSDLTTGDVNSSTKVIDDQKSVSCSSIEFNEDTAPEMDCVRLCALLKEQLVKCIQQIREKYYKGENLNLSEVFNFDGLAEETKKLEQLNVQEEQPTAEQAVKTPTTSGEKQPVADEAVARVETNEETVSTPIESNVSLSVPTEYFQVLPTAPAGHKFQLTIFHPNNTQQYYKAVQREHRMLKSSLPPGVWVKVFEDRMDLLSVMIEGPKKTPYEDGLFFFDIQLGRDYPKSPPQCSYISYCSDRLNPNLYEDGKVCVSLLGTWAGRDSEVWGPNSTLLQVIVSIQGLILVPEPYFNEAGYEKQKGTQQGSENSRMYNEMVIIKMVQSSTKLLQQPPELFRHEIHEHWKVYGFPMYERIKGWMELSKLMPNKPIEEATTQSATAAAAALQDAAQQATVVNTECNAEVNYTPPDFPLVPASRGFCLSLAGLLDIFKTKLITLNAIGK